MYKPGQRRFVVVFSVAFAIGALFAASAIAARPSDELTITIPFDFYLRFQKFSAGSYTLKHFRGAMFQIWNQEGKTERVSTNAIINDPTDPLKRLVFNEYGDKYFLTEVYWSDGVARRLPKCSSELEIAKQTPAKRLVLDLE